jgi:hypothetical protein
MTGALNWYRAVFGGRVERWRRRRIVAPVLLLFGTGDLAFDVDSVLPGCHKYCEVVFCLLCVCLCVCVRSQCLLSLFLTTTTNIDRI